MTQESSHHHHPFSSSIIHHGMVHVDRPTVQPSDAKKSKRKEIRLPCRRYWQRHEEKLVDQL
jgi:hypothetical protein